MVLKYLLLPMCVLVPASEYGFNQPYILSKRQYLLTLQVIRYCLLALQSRVDLLLNLSPMKCNLRLIKLSNPEEYFLLLISSGNYRPLQLMELIH